MAKRLLVLLGMLAVMLSMVVPALAETEPRLTGIIEKPELTTYQYGTHSMTDEVGDFYALESDDVDLDAYVGQRVTVFGSSVSGFDDGQVEGGPPLFDVTRVEPAGGPAPGSNATFTYELIVECEPPEDAEFLGFTAIESLVTTALTDADGDGVYTGSQTVPRFAPGGAEEPITISPVRIVQGPPTGNSAMGPEYRVLKDFGPVTAEDVTLYASVSFCDGGSGGAVVSGDTSDNEGIPSTTTVLPATGGILPIAGLVGLVTIFSGLVARRIIR